MISKETNFQKVFFTFLFFLFAVLSSNAQNCTVNAGIPQTVCDSDSLFLTAYAGSNLNAIPNFSWAQISGPNSATILEPDSLATAVIGLISGVYIFEFSADCEDNITAYNQVSITVNAGLANPAISDFADCGSIANITAPVYPGATYSWYEIGGDTYGWSISGNDNLATVRRTSLTIKTMQFGLLIEDASGICEVRDTFEVQLDGTMDFVCAGADASICGTEFFKTGSTIQTYVNCSNSIIFNSNVVSYPGDSASVLWTQVSGPSTATITDSSTATTGFTNLQTGIYLFEYKVTQPVGSTCFSGQDTFQLVVAGTSSDLTKPGYASKRFCDVQSEIVLDFGVQLKEGETVSWAIRSGNPGTLCASKLVITNPDSLRTTVTGFDDPDCLCEHDYGFVATISDGSCSLDATYYVRMGPFHVNDEYTVVLDCGKDDASYSTGTRFCPVPGLTYDNGSNSFEIVILESADPAWPAGPNKISGYSDFYTDMLPGTYVVAVQRKFGGSYCGPYNTLQTIIVPPAPPAANAGSDPIVACGVKTVQLTGNIPTTGQSGTWHLISGPNIPDIDDDNIYNATVSNMIDGEYVFRWIVDSGICGIASDDVIIRIASAPAANANAGSDFFSCYGSGLYLNADVAEPGSIGSWSVIPSIGLSFVDVNDPITAVLGAAASTAYQFIWTVSNTCGVDKDTVNVTTNAVQGPDIANAGPDQCDNAAFSYVFNLAANVPAAIGATGTWSILNVSGGSNGTFSDANDPFATYTYSSTWGNTTLAWTVDVPGCGSTVDSLVLTLANDPSTGSTYAAICNVNDTVVLDGGSWGVYGANLWCGYDGPIGATILDPYDRDAHATFTQAGTYVFYACQGSAECANKYPFLVYVSESGIADAGLDQTLCQTSSVTLDANSPLYGGYWSFLFGEQNNSTLPIIADRLDPNTDITGLIAGTYHLQWTAKSNTDYNGCGDKDTVTIFVIPQANAGPTTKNLCETDIVQIYGNPPSLAASGSWSQISGPNTATITNTDADGETIILSDMILGQYIFRYEISAPSCTSTDDITVNVDSTILAFAGDDFTACSENITLRGNDVGTVIGDEYWSYVNGPTGGNFTSYIYRDTVDYGTLVPNEVYTFKYRVRNGGCYSYDEITVVAQDPINFAVTGMDVSDCSLSDGSLNFSGLDINTSYLLDYSLNGVPQASVGILSNGVGEASLVNLGAGSYDQIVFSLDGCISLAQGPLVISEPAAILVSNISTENTSCAGVNTGSVTISASGGISSFEYSIDGTNWQSSNVFSNLNSGFYYCYVRNDDTTCVTEYPSNPVEIETEPCGSIEGTLYHDMDLNSSYGGIDTTLEAGILIELLDVNGDPVLDDFSNPITTSTDASGLYTFLNIPVGTDYEINVQGPVPSPYLLNTAYPLTGIVVTDGNINSGNNFGYVDPCGDAGVKYGITSDASMDTSSRDQVTDFFVDDPSAIPVVFTKEIQSHGIVRATNYCTVGNWRYYYSTLDPTEFLFAVDMQSNTTEIDYIDIRIDDLNDDRYAADADFATFVMVRDWNIITVGGAALTSPVNIRFYFPPNEFKQVLDSAQVKATQWGVTAPTAMDVMWFNKTNFDPDVDIDPSASVLLPENITTNQSASTNNLGVNSSDNTPNIGNGANYIQFDNMSSISGGSAMIFMDRIKLPVSLSSFYAKSDGCNVQLNWSSEVEDRLNHYEIQRAYKVGQFETINNVDAIGGNYHQSYQLQDLNAGEQNYYRLKMIDSDGSFEYSSVIEIQPDCDIKEDDFLLYPNPVGHDDGKINLKYYNNFNSRSIIITNAVGQTLKTIDFQHEPGWITSRIDISDLHAGFYNLRLESEKGRVKTKGFTVIR